MKSGISIGVGIGGTAPLPPNHHGNSDYTEWAHSPCTQLATRGQSGSTIKCRIIKIN